MCLFLTLGKWPGTPHKYNRFFGLRQEECAPGGCMMELFIQLAIIMIGKFNIYFLQKNHRFIQKSSHKNS